MPSHKTVAEPSETALPEVPKTTEHVRSDDYSVRYANNVVLESSGWDLKLIFGQTDASEGKNLVIQHSAVSLPWPQVKLFAFFLNLHILEQEITNGRIYVPPNVLREIPEQKPQGLQTSEEIWAGFRKLYEAFITANPEAAPNAERTFGKV